MKGKNFDWKGCMAHEVRHCKSTKMPWHHKVELSNWSWSRSWSWSVHGLFMVIVMFMIMVIVFVMNMVTFVVVKCQEASWNYKVAVTHTTGPYNYEIGHLREWAHIVCQTRQNNQASKMFCTFKLHIRLQLFSIFFEPALERVREMGWGWERALFQLLAAHGDAGSDYLPL